MSHSVCVRTGALLALALLCVSIVPASALPTDGTGTVELPTATAVPGRLAYLAAGGVANGPLAHVISLGSAPVPDGRPYSLRNLSGIGPVDLDVWFYSDLFGAAGEGYVCPAPGRTATPDGNGGEDGVIWCGDSNRDGRVDSQDRARWAVVFLFSGAHASFRLSW